MKLHGIFYAGSLIFVLMMSTAFPQVPLCPNDCEKLKPEAREHYNKAMEHLDRVYIQGTLEELREAAKLDPDHVNLHFLLARVARQRGKTENSLEASQKCYTIAENALLGIQKKEDLSKDQQQYLEASLDQVKKEKATLMQRNQRRMEVGYQIIMDYMKDVGRLLPPTQESSSTPATEGAPSTVPTTAASPGTAAAPSSSASSPFGFAMSLFGNSPAPSVSDSSPFGNTSGTAPGTSPGSAPPSSASPFSITSSEPPSSGPDPSTPSAPSTPSTPSDLSPFNVTSGLESEAPAPSTPPPATENPFANP